MLANAVRAHAAEFGVVVPKGIQRISELRTLIASADPEVVPTLAKSVLLTLATQIEALTVRVLALERQLIEWHRTSAASQRLTTIPGVGPITAKRQSLQGGRPYMTDVTARALEGVAVYSAIQPNAIAHPTDARSCVVAL
jgi:transposase